MSERKEKRAKTKVDVPTESSQTQKEGAVGFLLSLAVLGLGLSLRAPGCVVLTPGSPPTLLSWARCTYSHLPRRLTSRVESVMTSFSPSPCLFTLSLGVFTPPASRGSSVCSRHSLGLLPTEPDARSPTTSIRPPHPCLPEAAPSPRGCASVCRPILLADLSVQPVPSCPSDSRAQRGILTL